jgi:hypothetical protein
MTVTGEHEVSPTLMAAEDAVPPKLEPSMVMVAPPEVGFDAEDVTRVMDGGSYAKAKVDADAVSATDTTTAFAAPVPLGATHAKVV